MDTEKDMLQSWEEAFVAVSHDATVGRLFKGIVHNLNGVLQAFSMQGELLNLMFQQAGVLLDALEPHIPADNQETFGKLRRLIEQRAIIVQQMEEKIALSLNIMHNTMALRESTPGHANPIQEVNAIVKGEADFLSGDMFFKHKVEKHFHFAPDLPALSGSLLAIRFGVHAVLTNAGEALRESAAPWLSVSTRGVEGGVNILVEDTGHGIAPENLERIFEPFFTTRPGHIGVGLYLARKLLHSAGGRITAESRNGRTSFTIFYPC